MVVPNALSPTEVAALTEILDDHATNELSPETRHANFGLDLGDAPTQPRPAGGRAEWLESDRDTARLLSWGAPYLSLIDNPTVSPLLEDLLGPNFRLDHTCADPRCPCCRACCALRTRSIFLTYHQVLCCLVLDATLLRPAHGPADPTLCGTSRWHSGPQMWPRQRHEYFSCDAGIFSSGLTVVAYELCDVPEGTGMGAMPGTHKSVFPLTGLEDTLVRSSPLPTSSI